MRSYSIQRSRQPKWIGQQFPPCRHRAQSHRGRCESVIPVSPMRPLRWALSAGTLVALLRNEEAGCALRTGDGLRLGIWTRRPPLQQADGVRVERTEHPKKVLRLQSLRRRAGVVPQRNRYRYPHRGSRLTSNTESTNCDHLAGMLSSGLECMIATPARAAKGFRSAHDRQDEETTMAADALSGLLPTADEVMEKVALAEAEKASAEKRRQAKAEARRRR